MSNQQSDEELITEARAGDMLAFKNLVIRYERKVAGVVKSIVGDIPEAVDVGQEVFIRFYEALDKFKGDSTLGTYLIRIAINLSLNEIKRKKKTASFFRPLEDGERINSSSEKSNDLKEMVHHEINKLDNDFRLVVTLRMIEGYSTEETAELLGIPLGTVLSRLARAQKKLKTVFAKYAAL